MTTILILEPDNPCNTTIVDNADAIRYRVTTEHTKSKTVTYVKNAAGETIASSEWRDVQSDIITIGANPPVPSSTWLKKSMIPFKDTVTFQNVEGKKFKWKGNGPGLAFELWADKGKSAPIARFRKSRRVLNNTGQESTPARLVLDSRAEGMLDDIVVSFVFLEKSRRARENSTMLKADVLGWHGGGV